MIGKDDLLALLESRDIPFTCEHHDAVFTMDESSRLGLTVQGAHCKNLLLKDKDGQIFHVMTLASKSLDLTGVASALGSKRLSFASAELLFELLGVRPGSLSPLALINDDAHRVRLVIDEELAGESVFLMHPLENTATLSISRDDLEGFVMSTGHAPSWVGLAERQAS